MDTLRRIVAQVPQNAAVWVSNQLVPDAAVAWRGAETDARHGFSAREAGQSYLARRWRGAAVGLLASSDRPVYGLVQRHSTEVRNPADPRAADFVLLDISEDPLFLELTDADLVTEIGRLRLYRGAGHTLPPADLPFGESLPGRRQGFAIPRVRPAPLVTAGETLFAHLLWSATETDVTLETRSTRRRLALFPGFTWLVLREDSVNLAESEPAYVVASRRLRPSTWRDGEQLLRSRAGIAAPALLDPTGTGQREVRYVNLSARLVSVAARPQVSDHLWLAGRDAGPPLSLDPPASTAAVRSADDFSSWIEIGPAGRAALHAPPGAGLFSLPLLGEPVPPASVRDGTLVKGTSHRLHLVLNGRLHWIPTLEALQRRVLGSPVITLRDEDLWRLPIGLPLE